MAADGSHPMSDGGGGSAPQLSPTADAPGTPQPLYANRVKIQARKISGFWRTVKWWVLGLLLALYYIGPWIRWDRGPGAPDQALLIDMPGRRAYFFGLEIWPQEVYYLTGLLILGAIGLFLATALFGRVWCGFTCPQTVWTDLFMWVERLIEGDRNARIRLDKQPLNADKVLRKTLKHAAWLLIALATGGVWILYFNDAPSTIVAFVRGEAGAAVYGFTLLFTATTYLLAGWAREQVCIYMCPWPRFQSAMFDEDSLIVTYEAWRGEPRGGARKEQSFEGRGHCVDCGMCWQVCPTGVDIRKGQQMACIGCGLCIDACNSIMDRFGLPRELITYDSISNQVARETGAPTRLRLIRPRTIAYAVLLVFVAIVMAYSLLNRDRVDVNVIADRQPLFVRLSDGSIRNGFTVKILNMEREAKTFELSVVGLDGATMDIVGWPTSGLTTAMLPVAPDSIGSFKIYVKMDANRLAGQSTDFVFAVTDQATGNTAGHGSVFFGPDR